MSGGIRAEVQIGSPGNCPIADVSAETGTPTTSISRSVASGDGDTVAEEFMLDSDSTPDSNEFERVFSYGSKDVYRFDREGDTGCACEQVEQLDCPIADVYTREGSLHLVFHAPGMDQLKAVINTLKDRYDEVSVQRLIRSETDADDRELVFVDRSLLTDRQLECLETAHEMGYFDHPKGANAGEVASELGITTSTFTEHLAAAQSKLLSSIVDSR